MLVLIIVSTSKLGPTCLCLPLLTALLPGNQGSWHQTQSNLRFIDVVMRHRRQMTGIIGQRKFQACKNSISWEIAQVSLSAFRIFLISASPQPQVIGWGVASKRQEFFVEVGKIVVAGPDRDPRPLDGS